MDLQQGIQIFELRIYAAEMGHRMPLRHEIHQLILAGFHAHGIDMPFPPFQMRLESLNGKQTGRTLTSAGKGRQAGSFKFVCRMNQSGSQTKLIAQKNCHSQ